MNLKKIITMTKNLFKSSFKKLGVREDPFLNIPIQPTHEILNLKEIQEIDIRFLGSFIYNMAFLLSRKVNKELLEPMSKWIDDPEWMPRFSACEMNSPNWALYKRRQRNLTKRQKALFAERMRLYRCEIRRKRALREKVAAIIPRREHLSLKESQDRYLTSQNLTPILAPFSPVEQKKADVQQRFYRAYDLSISDMLPWKFLLAYNLTSSRCFADLTVHYPENRKKDIVSKLIHLLHMESDGEVSLIQSAPFGNIIIEPDSRLQENIADCIMVINDKYGDSYHFDWHHLTDIQRKKIIDDIKSNKILCKVVK